MAAIVFCVYGGVALSIDFPSAAFGFQSDEATYYMMGHSLAADGDLAYRREDLVRVWREFPSGPVGVFLKKGRDVDVSVTPSPPFVHFRVEPHGDQAELFFGKSYIYPVFAAPFVFMLGTNGFLLFHALLFGLVVFAAYAFVHARSSAPVAAILSSGFLMGSVVPAYVVWIAPELLNFSLVFLGYFCWLYKEVARPEPAPPGMTWLLRPASTFVAAALLALATFSKPSLGVLAIPLFGYVCARRQWRTASLSCALFVGVGAVLLAGNVAVSGEWNYQGGDRRTFYGPFPFQSRASQWETTGQVVTTNRVLTEVIFDRRVFWAVLGHNLAYIAVGRYGGLVPYFFPAVFATLAFLAARKHRRRWQWAILAAVAAEIVVLLIWMPYTHSGGGGGNGNRYFLPAAGVFLFLLPPIERIWLSMAPWAIGALFTAQITFNPFFAAFHPAESAKQGPLRWLPVELSMLDALPITAQSGRAGTWFGEDRRFQVYFLDDNVYPREAWHFWTRGRSRAEFVVKSAEGAASLDLGLLAGPVPVRVTASGGPGPSTSVTLAPRAAGSLSLPLDGGFPYQGTRVWHVSLTCDSGFVPMFSDATSEDYRYLGVRVTPALKR